MKLLVSAVEGDDDQAAIDAFDLAGAEGFVGDDGSGADLGGVDGRFWLRSRGHNCRFGRDIGGPVCIADGGTGGLDDLHFAVFPG